MVSEPTTDSASLDLLLVNRGLVGDVRVGGHLGHRDHELTEIMILGKVSTGFNRTATLDFQ